MNASLPAWLQSQTAGQLMVELMLELMLAMNMELMLPWSFTGSINSILLP